MTVFNKCFTIILYPFLDAVNVEMIPKIEKVFNSIVLGKNYKKMKQIITLLFLICFFCSCTKRNKPTIYLDVPFLAATTEEFYLYNSIHSGNSVIYNTVKFDLAKIEDGRCTELGCSSCYGSSADIYSKITLNKSIIKDTLSMPGCTGNFNTDWDTTSTYTPRFVFGNYKLFLLTLIPRDSKPSKQSDYSVKYVFKRK